MLRKYLGPILSTYFNFKKHIGLNNLTKKELESRDKFRVCSPLYLLTLGPKIFLVQRSLEHMLQPLVYVFKNLFHRLGVNYWNLFLYSSL